MTAPGARTPLPGCGMADNYIERQYEAYLAKKAAAQEARRAAFRRQLKAYRQKLALQAAKESAAPREEETTAAGHGGDAGKSQ